MTNTNQIAEIEYCETCGTMLIMGICRRCKPELTRTNKAGRVTKIYDNNAITSKSDNNNTHDMGVNYVAETLLNNDINSVITRNQNISLIIGKKTALVRTTSDNNRIFLVMNSLKNLITDYLIIVTNVKIDSKTKIYILPTEVAKKLSTNDSNGSKNINYFLNLSDYEQYQNNYSILN